MLKAALDRLWETTPCFCLNIYFTPTERSPYMTVHDRYTYAELETIFDKTDLLIAPSIWYETFGFQILEALSYGVPVLVSGNVGARDILAEGAGLVIENIDADKLYDCLSTITADQLEKMNRVILEKQKIPMLAEVAELLEKNCYQGRN